MSVNRFAHNNENAAFPFARNYFNCRCSIKEVSKMSKYIPKVGDKVLSDIGVECKILHVGEKLLFVRSVTGNEFSADFKYFKPIPTKADIEREQLSDIIYLYNAKDKSHSIHAASEIQRAGFTIPKKVKHSEIYGTILDSRQCTANECLVITEEICELLGDLVDSD
jgi:hypothetical protein